MKNVITIQHTQSIHHKTKMVGSWTDWELTDEGKAHTENIGKSLSAELSGQVYKIFCSDLLRTKQTAEPLAKYMGVEIEFLKELREHNLGEAIGQTGQWARENSQPTETFDDRQFPSAESWREFWNRVSDVCNKIIKDESENIIVVSHGVTLSVWQSVWLGLEIKPFEYSGMPGGVSFMKIDNYGKRTIERLNDPSYMGV